MASNETVNALTRIRRDNVAWSELAEFARGDNLDAKGAALMKLARTFGTEPRTMALLQELMHNTANATTTLMGIATVRDLCMLLLRELGTPEALEVFCAAMASWDPKDKRRLDEVLALGL